jgi:hypothetical protein
VFVYFVGTLRIEFASMRIESREATLATWTWRLEPRLGSGSGDIAAVSFDADLKLEASHGGRKVGSGGGSRWFEMVRDGMGHFLTESGIWGRTQQMREQSVSFYAASVVLVG